MLRYRFKSAGVKRIRLTIIDGKGRKARRTHKFTIRRNGRGAGTPGTGAPGVAPGTGTPGVPGSPPPPPPPTTKGCFADPSRCGYPDADNTGPAGGLTPVQSASLPSGAAWGGGTLRITGDNVTVQNLDIPGAVAVDGNNATIRNSRIAVSGGCSSPCGSYGIRLGADGDTVSGTTLANLDIVTAGGAKVDHGVRNNGDKAVTADRLYVKGFAGAWKGPGTINNSYLFSDLIFAGDHVEAYLNGGEGDPSILVHNTILNPIDQTAAISFFDDFGKIGQVDRPGQPDGRWRLRHVWRGQEQREQRHRPDARQGQPHRPRPPGRERLLPQRRPLRPVGRVQSRCHDGVRQLLGRQPVAHPRTPTAPAARVRRRRRGALPFASCERCSPPHSSF